MKTKNVLFVLFLIGSLATLIGCAGYEARDTDGDGMKDGEEVKVDRNPLVADAPKPSAGSRGETSVKEDEGEGTKVEEEKQAEGDTTPAIGSTEESKSAANIQLGACEHQQADLEMMQKSADQGRDPWRLDPYKTAQNEGVNLGFNPSQDSFKLISQKAIGEYSGTGEAEVEAVHQEVTYIIQLIQPMGPGPTNIWVINSVRKK